MGSNISTEQNHAYLILQSVLKQHGKTLDESSLQSLLLWVQHNFTELNVTNFLDNVLWDRVGVRLWEEVTQGNEKTTKVLKPWRILYETLRDQATADQTLPEIPTTNPGTPNACIPLQDELPMPLPLSVTETVSELPRERQFRNTATKHVQGAFQRCNGEIFLSTKVPGTTNSLSEENCWDPEVFDTDMTTLPDPRLRWEGLRREAAVAGDIDMLKTFPVYKRPNRLPHWEPVPYPVLKDLKKSVTEYGLEAPFTMGILENLFSAFTLTPHDCSSIARMTLTTMQFTLFETEWKNLSKKTAEETLATNRTPIANTLNKLLGEGPYAAPAAQARIPLRDLNLAKDLTLQVFRKISKAVIQSPSFTMVHQGPQEPFFQFADRFRDEINKQIDNTVAQDALFQKLTVEQANPDCQKILRAMRNPTLAEMLQACNNVGTQVHASVSLAEALVTARESLALQERCFGCGQTGHIRRYCRAKR
ncbi:endogenous retrovirus group K member 5 Gag polyprotein-like [Corapipo altera]|uniref:endogenous retrovirus group K member 5 Gag polyprotein-like n=1 Tax=Corapipo altera TaxID=415028 RepID=UPI000FD64C10|nr:endogenous retrovirus group K member 5 Gag polyprotein-like [Corapipo altera]